MQAEATQAALFWNFSKVTSDHERAVFIITGKQLLPAMRPYGLLLISVCDQYPVIETVGMALRWIG